MYCTTKFGMQHLSYLGSFYFCFGKSHMNYLLLKYMMFRCNMFSHALILYQNTLVNFWEKTAKTMNHVNNGFKVNHRPNYH